MSSFRICEAIYKVTNLQGELADFGASLAEINLWETIESKLSPTRTHTSLSVGDEVEIDGRAYVCKDLGLSIRGVHGEHSESSDGIYDISNKRRLGVTEREIYGQLYNGVKKLIDLEKSL